MTDNFEIIDCERLEMFQPDVYEWNESDEVKTARKVIDRRTETKRVYWEYWNGEDYVKPQWFEDHFMQVPERPTFYVKNFKEFSKSERVVIVEGEKDVETLMGLGIPATTLQSGSSKISDDKLEELKLFEGMQVYLIGDNDPTGETYINDLALKLNKSCYPDSVHKADIKELWEDVPLKGDITDWFANEISSGNASKKVANKLKLFLREQPEYMPPTPDIYNPDNYDFFYGNDILNMEEEKVEWLVEGMIASQGLIQLAGTPKSGKSVLANQLCMAIAQDEGTFLGHEVAHGKVLYVDFENTTATIHERIDSYNGGEFLDNNNLMYMMSNIDTEIRTINEGFVDELDSIIQKKVGGYDLKLIVIDLFKYIQSDGKNNNTNLHDTKELHKLTMYSHEHKIPIMLINHTTKEQKTDGNNPFERSMGSQSVFGAMETQMILRAKRDRYGLFEEAFLYVTGRNIEETAYSLKKTEGDKVGFDYNGSMSDIIERKRKRELEESDLGYGIKELLSTMRPGESWRGTSKDLLEKLDELDVPVDEDITKNSVTRFFKNKKSDIEHFFNCQVQVIESGKHSKKLKIVKSKNESKAG